jgi:hypothetical protein
MLYLNDRLSIILRLSLTLSGETGVPGVDSDGAVSRFI